MGWATCAYLWRRNRSPRDRWYACYLLTYTFTQLVDIALWTLHDATEGGLRGCDEFKLQLTDGPSGEARAQYALSKYVVPLVTLSQFATMLQYPSERLREHRSKLVAFHALACLGMALQFACTDTVTSRWPIVPGMAWYLSAKTAAFKIALLAGSCSFSPALRCVRF